MVKIQGLQNSVVEGYSFQLHSSPNFFQSVSVGFTSILYSPLCLYIQRDVLPSHVPLYLNFQSVVVGFTSILYSPLCLYIPRDVLSSHVPIYLLSSPSSVHLEPFPPNRTRRPPRCVSIYLSSQPVLPYHVTDRRLGTAAVVIFMTWRVGGVLFVS
jgi:hypothetical protein